MADLCRTLGLFSRKPAALLLLILRLKQLKAKKKKRLWTRKWLARREELGATSRLAQELVLEDVAGYRQWMRLSRQQFLEILAMIEPAISKQDTRMRKAVTAEARLSITLRYIAAGESQTSLAHKFRVSQNLISSIIPEVCTAIYYALQPQYMVVPSQEETWRAVARGFETLWQFPKCIGALDGKRVLVQKPSNTGSQYYDYKGHFSIILMALIDADYKFLYVDVGKNGRASDAGVWSRCTLSPALESNSLSIPPPESLPFSNTESPFVIVGDDAFPLKTYLMKPYPGAHLQDEERISNYRLSRARRISENAFGILVSRFQIYRQPICTSPECVKKIVLATVVLHNYLRVKGRSDYCPMELLDREDIPNRRVVPGNYHNVARGGLEPIQAVPRRPSQDAMEVRNKLKTHFNTVGSVYWQRDMAYLH